MEAVIAIALLFLPVIIYFTRSPSRPSNADVLSALLGIWLGLTTLIYLGNLFAPKIGGYWFAGLGWVGMLAYAWIETGDKKAKNGKRNAR
ncbi:hypothetical protein [Aromatoleum evansii]|uniref:hypothetical protein n=1 Tax=Aromatoleum evansii TaxID=59406 RepID=UPI00145E2496|nr:hypothetical protein [Aromatoleum evansii]NMG31271.1 hypothetical protein [Aromatoleum evansii]